MALAQLELRPGFGVQKAMLDRVVLGFGSQQLYFTQSNPKARKGVKTHPLIAALGRFHSFKQTRKL